METEKRMIDCIGAPAMYELLAEESAELAKAALKMARVLRQENPTPVTLIEAESMVREEWTDVIQCAEEINIMIDLDQIEAKQKRFFERWEQHHERE